MTPMTCPACGLANPSESSFCNRCGGSLAGGTLAPSPIPSPPAAVPATLGNPAQMGPGSEVGSSAGTILPLDRKKIASDAYGL